MSDSLERWQENDEIEYLKNRFELTLVQATAIFHEVKAFLKTKGEP